MFAGKLVAIENASCVENLRVLAPEADWQPAPLEMVDFSIPRFVREARPLSCPQYYAELTDVRVVAGIAAILIAKTGEIVSDAVSRRRADLNVEWYRKYGLVIDEQASAQCFTGRGQALKVARAVSLFSWENRNYAHWLIEKLASLSWITASNLPPDTKLLVEAGLPESIIESLLLLWPAEHILFVEHGQAVDVAQLYYFSDAAEIWEPRKGYIFTGNDYRLNPQALRWLAGAVRKRVPVAPPAARRAYLVRPSGGNGRAVVNQDELIALLGSQGYDCIQPAKLSFAEQVNYFSGLELAVSPSGAALANLLWMPAGSAAVVLIQDIPQMSYWFYHALAAALGMRLVFFPIRGVPKPGLVNFHWDTEVPVQALADWLGHTFPVSGLAADPRATLRDFRVRQRGERFKQVAESASIDVTVAVMSYNNAAYVADTVRSVLGQQGVSFELIVRDDCSSDDSLAVLQSFVADPLFRLERNTENLGAIGNYNRCIDSGSGRYVVVLGSDDILYPGHLAALVRELDAHPQAALGYSQCNWINAAGDVLRYADHPGHRQQSYCGGRDEVVDLLSFDNYVTPSATMFRRSALDAIRLPDGGIHRAGMLAGDWELAIRIARVAPDFVFVRQPSVGYRVHDKQISRDFYASAQPLAEHIEILKLNLAEPAVLPRLRAAAERVWGLLQSRALQMPESARENYRAELEAIRAQLYAGHYSSSEDRYWFTVILTTFNRPELLVDALASLAAQTWRDFEVILVNDHGSPVEALIADCEFPLTYLYLGRNSGLSAARNAGLRQARGRYIVYLDDDDIYLPDHLAVLAATHAQHPDKVAYTGVVYVQEKLEDGRRIELGREEPFRHQQFSREQLFLQNYIPVNTWSHPRSAIDVVGGFDESLTALEDWDMLLKLAQRYDFIHEPRVTSEVHVRPSSGSDHMLGRERKNFPALYRKLYQRHGDLGNAALAQARDTMLQQMDASEVPGQAPARVLSFLDVYAAWRAERRLLPSHGQLFDARMAAWPCQPRIVPVIFDEAGNIAALVRTIRSMTAQYYHPAHIVILSVKPAPAGGAGDNVSWMPLDAAWPQTLTRALPEESDWLWLLHAGDELEKTATLLLAELVISRQEARCAYTDEDWLKADGQYDLPIFRPDFNLELLRNTPYVGRSLAVSVAALADLGGFDAQYGALAHIDFLFRVLERDGWPAIAHFDDMLYHSALAYGDWINLEPVQTQLSPVVAAHLSRLGLAAELEQGALPSIRSVRYQHAAQPVVSVLLVAPRELAALQRCVERLIEVTAYPNYELLVIDGHGDQPALRDYLAALDALGNPRLRTFACDDPFNDAAIVNVLAQQAQGEYLVLLDAAAEVVGTDWIEQLLNHAQRPEVGVVGGKVLSADGHILQAPQVLGLRGAVGSPFLGLPHDAQGYMNRLLLDQDCSAVSRACMMVRKSVFAEVGGLDAAAFAQGLADADFCLRVHAAGFLAVWTPRVVTVQRAAPAPLTEAACSALLQRWLPKLAADPAYNRNLFLHGNGFELEPRAQLCWRPLSWRPLPLVLAHPGDAMGCGQYRVIQPFLAQQQALQIDGHISWELLHPVDVARLDPDVLVLQRQINEEQIAFIRQYQRYARAFKVYELDDYLPKLPMKSAHRAQMPKDVLKQMRKALSLVDRFVVSTAELANAYSELGLHRDIRVVENRLPPKWWRDLSSIRCVGPRPRVGWGGGMSHTGDLELIVDVVKELANEVDWVFFGMCPDVLRPYVREFHSGVPIEQYPAKLASLNLDLALAPLEHNLFNECKSNLRLLEYGACGYPVIATDIVCYRGDLPVTLVKNRFRDWVEAIRVQLADLDAAAAQGDALREAVLRDWMLEGQNLDAWRQAWLPD